MERGRIASMEFESDSLPLNPYVQRILQSVKPWVSKFHVLARDTQRFFEEHLEISMAVSDDAPYHIYVRHRPGDGVLAGGEFYYLLAFEGEFPEKPPLFGCLTPTGVFDTTIMRSGPLTILGEGAFCAIVSGFTGPQHQGEWEISRGLAATGFLGKEGTKQQSIDGTHIIYSKRKRGSDERVTRVNFHHGGNLTSVISSLLHNSKHGRETFQERCTTGFAKMKKNIPYSKFVDASVSWNKEHIPAVVGLF